MSLLITRLQAFMDSPDYVGLLDIPEPATLEDVLEAEKALGFELPALLKQLYLEVANGGFGPGYGIIGVAGGATDDQGDSVIKLYRSFPVGDPDDEDSWYWPEKLLPFCHWGDAIYSCLDCKIDDGAVYIWDAGELEPEASSLSEWLTKWLDSVGGREAL